MSRPPGLSARWKLTLSYAGFVLLAGALLLATVWVFLLRYVPAVIDLPQLPRPGSLGPPQTFVPNRWDLLRAFVPRVLEVLALLLVFGLAGGWFLAGRMLAPLRRITHATRVAAAGSLSHRIRMEGRRDEFRELSDAFDSMLARLEANVAEQQRFAANASHELRTPLAISRTLIEVARKDPGRDRDEVLERLDVVNQRAIGVTEALLLLGRSERGDLPYERIDLSLIAEEAAETLLPLAEQRGITLEVSGAAAPAGGAPELLLRMAVNLVQNAIVHNLPSGGSVRVHAGPGLLRVENTGPVVPARLLPTLTEPFQRGTERTRTEGHAGAGLGLALVASIVRAHRGGLSLEPRAGGGLIVTVRLP